MRLFFGLGLSAPEAIALADWRQRCVHCDGRPVPIRFQHFSRGVVFRRKEIKIVFQEVEPVLGKAGVSVKNGKINQRPNEQLEGPTLGLNQHECEKRPKYFDCHLCLNCQEVDQDIFRKFGQYQS